MFAHAFFRKCDLLGLFCGRFGSRRGLVQAAEALLTPDVEADWQAYILYFFLGYIAQEADDLPTAIAYYDRTIALFPVNFAAYLNRGNAYNELGDDAAALADYSRAIENDPTIASGYTNRAWVHTGQGNYEAALADLTVALRLEPTNANVWHDRGLIFHQLGHYTDAIRNYKMAIRIHPSDADYYINRGQTYNSIEDYTAAIDDYTRALALDPNNAYAYRSRAISQLFQLNIPAAESDLRRAVTLDASDSYAVELLAWVLYFQEDYAAAYPVYEQLQALTSEYRLDDTAAQIADLEAQFGPTPTPQPLVDARFAAGTVVTLGGRGIVQTRDTPNGIGSGDICTANTNATVLQSAQATNGTRWVQIECDGGTGWLLESDLEG